MEQLEMLNFTKDELQKLADNKQLIDVRSKEEYDEVHIPGALLYPLDEIETFDLPKDREYYAYCRSGKRSEMASQYLEQLGYEFKNLNGGIIAYVNKVK
ncbi:rhodanese-like domain-containing protein [Nosocomiicoccus massiliensis]|uniref:rhodanese-like domain-containing protein n=1 Tax=Nosocomiicoccus massiliensis TaxID=1232430 RepID=UPI000409972C|nr:rhodanese-like domain-containing protein [Nosocomiicoccus massiliensis]